MLYLIYSKSFITLTPFFRIISKLHNTKCPSLSCLNLSFKVYILPILSETPILMLPNYQVLFFLFLLPFYSSSYFYFCISFLFSPAFCLTTFSSFSFIFHPFIFHLLFLIFLFSLSSVSSFFYPCFSYKI